MKPEEKAAASNLPQPIHRQLTIQSIEEHNQQGRMDRIEAEFKAGFDFIKKFKKTVSIYGSARFTEENIHWKAARRIAERIVKELDCAVVTGGGHGIMEAANRGAFEAKGISIGLNITLPHEQTRNDYLTDTMEFYYFFIRKVMLSFSAEAYLFFPGGFGTLDEFFEILMLVQTRKIAPVPIILVGKDYWMPFKDVIEENVYQVHKAIEKQDMKLFSITDDEDEILSIIKNAPIRGQD